MQTAPASRRILARFSAIQVLACSLASARTAHASFLSGEALDTAADVMAWVVLVVVPIIAIAVFWIVHVMPEKIAHRRHHPQTQAIQTLCLLSLVFGGLLWPIAWIWAYTRPVAYKLAYGTDKHDEYFAELERKVRNGEALPHEMDEVRRELDVMHARGVLPPHLEALRQQVAAMTAAPAEPGLPPARAGVPAQLPELERRSA
jgi:hypothetical protein